jgi:hypothetical protein
MSINILVKRGEQVIGFVPISSLRFFRDSFHPAVTQLGFEWLPDVIGRASLWINSKNKGDVLTELRRLKEECPSIGKPNDRALILIAAAKIQDAIEKYVTDDEVTLDIG